MFDSREQCGQLLAQRMMDTFRRLGIYDFNKLVVVAASRGGVPIAVEIAIALRCAIDVLLTRKIPFPHVPEIEMGAISSEGVVVISDDSIAQLASRNGNARLLEDEKEQLKAEARATEKSWLESADIHAHLDIEGKIVILVDDGVMTGMTMMTALRTMSKKGAAIRIVAMPVLPYSIYSSLKTQCDLLFSLAVPHEYSPASMYYRDFHTVDDSEVVSDLRRWSFRYRNFGRRAS
jgi:putative phosphoribosyl transferase